MGSPLGHGVLDDIKRDRSMRHRREDGRALLVRNNAAPDQRRLPANTVERIMPLLDPRRSANLGGDHEMRRPVLVDEPEQFLECAQRTRYGGRSCLVERHARSPCSCGTMATWPLSR